MCRQGVSSRKHSKDISACRTARGRKELHRGSRPTALSGQSAAPGAASLRFAAGRQLTRVLYCPVRERLSTVAVNGRTYDLDLREDRSLADVLRSELGLTGTKIGCGEGVCGACTVIMNGRAVRSCRIPASRAAGAAIETIEGLAGMDGRLHPLQEAFIRHGAVQCGFCTPGMIMAAKALIDQHRARGTTPGEGEVRRRLKGNFCRCTGYHAIVRAVLDAAGVPVDPVVPAVRPGRYIGSPLPRKDAIDKVTGRALYADDLHFPGMLYAAVRRAGIPHARIVSVDTR
ncbi:MAG TPA: 2Fe-2S iron-sulfur cluster binding domain-containing protein, partial [Kiritimatiellae bacterium]|nr:2Fe-2S iron-sulfur cluster binding domain-containing protein [Kiritimatiellia bacterium]